MRFIQTFRRRLMSRQLLATVVQRITVGMLVVVSWQVSNPLRIQPRSVQADEDEIDYVRDVKSVLRQRCFACHGNLKQSAGLRLDSIDSLLAGGDSGSVIDRQQPQASLLLERISAVNDDNVRMPPEGAPLSNEQIAAISRWLQQGAPATSDDHPDPDPRDHWAFRAPTAVNPWQELRDAGTPISTDSTNLQLAAATQAKPITYPANPIDAILALQRRQQAVQAVPTTERGLLLRRVYLDLLGLPPTAEQLERFLSDPRPESYERVVDELLASPHYGERWARHWMDVWRYSDWYGLGDQLRYSQKHIWHWRDWIVESLNRDVGYDQMILHMLAADELIPTDHNSLRATGFLARNYYLFNRNTWLENTVEHTAKAFLGLTLNCAKCHDHKYDPLTQEDYYRFRAIFEPHQVRLDQLPGEIDLERDGLARVFDAHPDASTYLFIRGNDKDPDTTRALQPNVPAVLQFCDYQPSPISLPTDAHAPHVQAFVLRDQLAVAQKDLEKARVALRELRQQTSDAVADLSSGTKLETAIIQYKRLRAELQVDWARSRVEAIRSAAAADVARLRADNTDALAAAVSQAAMAARQVELLAARSNFAALKERQATFAWQTQNSEAGQGGQSVTQPTEQAQQSSANVSDPTAEELRKATDKVAQAETALTAPGDTYESLRASMKALEGPDETDESRRAPYPTHSTGRRLALARWLIDRQNPLTARVAVNHIWLRHMGQPLVQPVDDFGLRTKAPIQQRLLDYLAVRLMSQDWSIKDLHRLIVTSQAYQMSSAEALADDATRARDPQNDYYWRRVPQRMQAEVVRDSLLHLANVLTPRLGGVTLNPSNSDGEYRRSLYFKQSADDQHRFLAAFDAPDIFQCYRRSESVVPQQALALANSETTLNMARRIAIQLLSRLPPPRATAPSARVASTRTLAGTSPPSEVLKRAEDADRSAASSISTDEGLDDTETSFIQAAYVAILCRHPTAAEITACRHALQRWQRFAAAEIVGTPQATDCDKSTPTVATPAVSLRAAHLLIHALLNQNDFITIR